VYIAGLNIPLSPTQSVEGLLAFTALAHSIHLGTSAHSAKCKGDKIAGPALASRVTLAGRLTSPLATTATYVTPVLFALGVGANDLQQPWWMKKLCLPVDWSVWLGPHNKVFVRLAGACGALICGSLVSASIAHLGSQFHYIGVRERAMVVTSGPFAYIRHPIYSLALVQQVMYAAMFWSYAPLVTLAISAAAFSVKIPIEEKLIEEDILMGPSYTLYKRRVTSRLIPYIW